MPEDKSKRMIKSLLGIKSKVTDWEKGFIKTVEKASILSIKQREIVRRMFLEYIENDADGVFDNLEQDDVVAQKSKSGWSITLHGKKVGYDVTRKEAATICPWLQEAYEDIMKIKQGDSHGKKGRKSSSNKNPAF